MLRSAERWEKKPVSKATVEGVLAIGRKHIIGRNERHGRRARFKEGLRFTGDARAKKWRGLPGIASRRLIRWRIERSRRRHVCRARCVAKSIARIGAGALQILLVLVKVSWLTWIGLRLAQSIPEFRRIDNLAAESFS